MKRNFFGYLYKDIVNYFNFKRVIKRELKNKDSIFNEYRLQHNYNFTKIGFVLTLPDECAQIDDESRRYFVVDKMTPVIKYLDEDLQFNEYLTIKEPDEFMYIDDNGEQSQTLSYLIEFEFDFKVLSWGLVLKLLILIMMCYYGYTIFA